MLRRGAQTARFGQSNGGEGLLCIRDVEPLQNRAAAAVAQAAAVPDDSAACASGAQSRTMPRFVLQPTASRVRRIASKMRAPTDSAGAPIAGALACALASKSAVVMS